MKSIFNKFEKLLLIAILFLGSAAASIAQLPTDIDLGQEVNPPSLWQNPRYIIPIAVIVVFLVGFGWWRRSKRN